MAGAQAFVSGVAGRYANALFELAREQKAVDAVRDELNRFDRMVAESPDLERLVRSPAFGADEQLRALTAVLDRAGISGVAANFILLVTSNRRLFAIRDMIRGYGELVAREKGEVSATVTLAEQPSDRHVAAIRDALNAVTRKDVQVDIKVDPEIIGGLVVKLGSRMVDTSLRTKLNAMKLAMKEAR